MHDKRFQSSGLNSHFQQDNSAFHTYVQHMRTMIAATRTDLNQHNKEYIINANAPFELQPTKIPCKNGVILVHGLLDSPYSLRALAQHLHKQGFWVRSLLLPGHGSVPGDLLTTTYQDWLAAARYAVMSLSDRVDNIYYVGFSTGGALGIHLAQQQLPIKKLILLAPALKIKNPLACTSGWARWWRCLGARSQWLIQTQDNDYTRYESITLNAIYQVYALTRLIEQHNRTQSLDIPILVVSTTDDEVVSHRAIVKFMQQQHNSQNRLLIYGNHTEPSKVTTVTRTSAYPAEKILDFSHLALVIPPTDPHYGRQGDYQDIRHYQGIRKFLVHSQQGERYRGATSLYNLRHYHLQRLTYNPDFNNMLTYIDRFIAE